MYQASAEIYFFSHSKSKSQSDLNFCTPCYNLISNIWVETWFVQNKWDLIFKKLRFWDLIPALGLVPEQPRYSEGSVHKDLSVQKTSINYKQQYFVLSSFRLIKPDVQQKHY